MTMLDVILVMLLATHLVLRRTVIQLAQVIEELLAVVTVATRCDDLALGLIWRQ